MFVCVCVCVCVYCYLYNYIFTTDTMGKVVSDEKNMVHLWFPWFNYRTYMVYL